MALIHSRSCRKSETARFINFIPSQKAFKASTSSLRECPLSQLSVHKFFLEPFPTPQQIPLENIGNPSLMAVQLGDEGSLSGSSDLLLPSTC